MPSHNHGGSTNASGNHRHQIWASGAKSGGSKEDSGIYQTGTATDWKITWGVMGDNGNHSHTVNINSNGSSQSHNNMQPYIACYIWKRTA